MAGYAVRLLPLHANKIDWQNKCHGIKRKLILLGIGDKQKEFYNNVTICQ